MTAAATVRRIVAGGRSATCLLTLLVLLPGLALAVSADPETIVYTTNALGDNRYHQSFCPKANAGFGKLPIKLQDALDGARRPCPKCKPPDELTYRIAAPEPKRIKSDTGEQPTFHPFGDSAADIEKDPDGTAIGKGGGFASTAGNSDSSSSETGLTAYESGQDYNILSIEAKPVDSSYGYTSLSFLVLVKNLTTSERAVQLFIQGVDSSGFELDFETIACTLPAANTTTCTGSAMLSDEVQRRISQWRPK